jgi:hypothetical protein
LPAPQLPQQISSQKFFFFTSTAGNYQTLAPVKKMVINFHQTGIQNAKEDQENK